MKNALKIWLLILLISPSASNCQGKQQQKSADIYTRRRLRMVKTQIEARGVKDTLVLNAMKKVPRHLFVPENMKGMAYWDRPLPIGEDQTISQPYIVAFMTEKLKLKGKEKVLEIGTGSGYQAAVLAEIAKEVYTIEIIPKLGKQARTRLESLGYKNVHVKIGDGYRGWPEHAPFDAIIVTAAPDQIPQPLIEQLKRGGSMIIPVGNLDQNLLLVTKNMDGTVRYKSVLPVIFVPMTGEAQKQHDKRK